MSGGGIGSDHFTQIMQPIEVTKSKRFMKDKMNVSDIARPDVYGKPRQFEGRDYLNAHDIEGSSPS
jgi:hypothetical protein